MQVFDIHHTSEAQIAFANADITTDTTTNGAIIDTKDSTALEFILASGTITDGDYTVSLQHGDDPGLSDTAAVAVEETLGVAVYTDSDSDTAKRLGYIGKKRYVQIEILSANTSTGGTNFSAMALIANAKHQPTSDQ